MQSKSRTAPAQAVPVYLRIRNAVREAISSGAYAPGDLLPSETDLAKRYGTTRATVVHALQQLVFEGLIERKRGLGSFVAHPALGTTVDTRRVGYFEQDVYITGKALAYKVIGYGKGPVDDHVRSELRLEASEPVYRLQRLRLLDGEPIAFEMRYLPALLGSQLTPDLLSRHSLQNLLDGHIGMRIDRYVNTVRVALPPAAVARHLKIAPGRPVMVRTHTFLDARGVPLLWGETLYREEYKLHYTLETADAAR